MYLKTIENGPARSGIGEQVQALRHLGVEVPQLLHIFAARPEMSRLLGELSEVIMRGPSRLGPGLREMIAAFASARNHCVF